MALPRTLDELISAIELNNNPQGLFWGMVGPPRAYFDIRQYGSFDVHLKYEAISVMMKGEREKCEPELIHWLWTKLVDARAFFEADDINLLFWRRSSRITLEEDDGVWRLNTRLVIPGYSFPSPLSILAYEDSPQSP